MYYTLQLLSILHTCIFAGGRSDYHTRAHHISDLQKHVFEPMMKRCLEEKPAARGTFEDASEEIQIHLKKYGGKNQQRETQEGNKVKVQYNF